MKFELVFDSEEYLYNLVGVWDTRLVCEKFAGASLNDMPIFEYKGAKFIINTNFSGFLGIIIHD